MQTGERLGPQICQLRQDQAEANPESPCQRCTVAYVVYSPPLNGLPFLAVILMPDGSVSARQFDTAEDAEKFTREMSKAERRAGAHTDLCDAGSCSNSGNGNSGIEIAFT